MNIIRKITLGTNPKDAMVYKVGNTQGEDTVCAILEDYEFYERMSSRRYNIYLKEADGSEKLWKSVENMPVLIEYDCRF